MHYGRIATRVERALHSCIERPFEKFFTLVNISPQIMTMKSGVDPGSSLCLGKLAVLSL